MGENDEDHTNNAQPNFFFFYSNKSQSLKLLKPENNCGASCCTCLEKHGLEPLPPT